MRVLPDINALAIQLIYLAVAREAGVDRLVTTDRDFETLCEGEPFEYTNPVPDDVLAEFHAVPE